MAVPGQVEGVGQHDPGLFVVRVGISELFLDPHELFLDPHELSGDAVLFGFEEVEGDRSGVVGVEELLALGGQLGALLFHLPTLATNSTNISHNAL